MTWGVFPGQEIVQPTVAEKGAFLAWKSEAFEIWRSWGRLYQNRAPKTYNLINEIASSWYLVNLVNNNFKSRLAIFDLLESMANHHSTTVNHSTINE